MELLRLRERSRLPPLMALTEARLALVFVPLT
jgi:hypothetical protein